MFHDLGAWRPRLFTYLKFMLFLARKADLQVPAGIPDEFQWLGVVDVAAIIKQSPKTVRRWRQAGRLPPSFTVFGQVKWRKSDILEWMRVQSPR